MQVEIQDGHSHGRSFIKPGHPGDGAVRTDVQKSAMSTVDVSTAVPPRAAETNMTGST